MIEHDHAEDCPSDPDHCLICCANSRKEIKKQARKEALEEVIAWIDSPDKCENEQCTTCHYDISDCIKSRIRSLISKDAGEKQ